jgi:hypothetical protein
MVIGSIKGYDTNNSNGTDFRSFWPVLARDVLNFKIWRDDATISGLTPSLPFKQT